MMRTLFFLLLLTASGMPKDFLSEEASLSKIPEYAGDFDPEGWSFRSRVLSVQGGLKQLELPLPVLAHGAPSFKDLRLVHEGRQVPYLLEGIGNVKTIEPQKRLDTRNSDSHRSLWEFSFPYSKLPLHTLSAEISDALFDRKVDLFENRLNARGETHRFDLGAASWKRDPGYSAEPLLLPLRTFPESSVLTLEIQNGDNAPLSFSRLEFRFQTARLIFKAPAESPLWLYYGNPKALPPSYDAISVLQECVSWPSEPVSLGAEEVLGTGFWANLSPDTPSGKILFWFLLSGVVVVLLIVIAKLLPENKKE